MNAMSTPSLQTLYNRRILALVDVPLWVKKPNKEQAHKYPIITLPLAIDRLQTNPRLEHLFAPRQPMNPPAQPPNVTEAVNATKVAEAAEGALTSADGDNSKTSDMPEKIALEPRPNWQQSHQRTTHEHTEETKQAIGADEAVSVDLPEHSAEIKFFLQGVRCGRWVLMADVLAMSREEQSLWESLKNALSTQALRQTMVYFYREIHYPLVKNEFRLDEGLNPAQYTFDGFVIGMSMSDEASLAVQMAFLTDIPVGIHTHSLVELPLISQMLQDASLKRILWRQIFG